MAQGNGADRPRGERRRHFRGRGAGRRRVDVRYRPSGADDRWQTAETDDIGIGGAFVLCGAPLPVGTMLEVEVWIPTSDQTIAVHGEVRWSSTAERAGMGLRFNPLDVESLLALSEYFASLTEPPPAGPGEEPAG
jgi:hypothetical protein